MSDGSQFQVCGAATENARRAISVRVLAADCIGRRKITEAEQEHFAVPYNGCSSRVVVVVVMVVVVHWQW